MVPIYISSFFRKDMTDETIRLICERTALGTYELHCYDNNSDIDTRNYLYGLLNRGILTSLHLDNRNTGCLYNKGVYHAMTESSQQYYCVTDNDIYPPLLTPDWLSQMVAVMNRHPELAFLTPFLPPIQLAMPEKVMDDIIYCQAIGNFFKLVRREAYPLRFYDQSIGIYGDDGLVCKLVRDAGWKVACCKNIFCWHAGQCDNWGYRPEELVEDPRKQGYGPPFIYRPVNELTYEPPPQLRLI